MSFVTKKKLKNGTICKYVTDQFSLNCVFAEIAILLGQRCPGGRSESTSIHRVFQSSREKQTNRGLKLNKNRLIRNYLLIRGVRGTVQVYSVQLYRVSQKCCGSLKGVIRGVIANNFFLCENALRGFVNEILIKSTDQSERESDGRVPALAWLRAALRLVNKQLGMQRRKLRRMANEKDVTNRIEHVVMVCLLFKVNNE